MPDFIVTYDLKYCTSQMIIREDNFYRYHKSFKICYCIGIHLHRYNFKVLVYDEHFVHKYFTHYQIAIFLSKPMHWIVFAEILMAKSVLKIRPCLKYLWRLKTQFIEEVNYTDNWILDYVCIGAQSRLCLFGNRKKVTKNRI